jgi:hypothetical protein
MARSEKHPIRNRKVSARAVGEWSQIVAANWKNTVKDEVYETSQGTIRCPTPSVGSILELSASGVSVLKRYVRPDGTPHSDHTGNWRVLRADEMNSYYYWPQLRAWFIKHGFTEALLRELEQIEATRKAAWIKQMGS